MSKLANEIATEARQGGFLSTGSRGAAPCIADGITREFEQFIDAKLKPVRDALRETAEWISSWSPAFTEDGEWPGTQAKIESALALFEEE